MESTWEDGIHMESTWKDEFHVEMLWNLCEKFHTESMWNGGIYMESTPFHVEYRWKKITKMGEISAKIYSMWNNMDST